MATAATRGLRRGSGIGPASGAAAGPAAGSGPAATCVGDDGPFGAAETEGQIVAAGLADDLCGAGTAGQIDEPEAPLVAAAGCCGGSWFSAGADSGAAICGGAASCAGCGCVEGGTAASSIGTTAADGGIT